MTTTQINPDTTIYIIFAGEPQWYAATDTAEEAVAEAIAGIRLNIDPGPFRVSRMLAGDFAEYDDTLEGTRRAEHDAKEIRTYDHEEALELAETIDGSRADDRVNRLDEQLSGL